MPLKWPTPTLLICLLLTSCQQPDKPINIKSFSDPNPLIRISTMKWAVENEVLEAVEPLVAALADEDASVRFFAIQALEKLTGQNHGYEYQANALQRQQAIARWHDYLQDREP